MEVCNYVSLHFFYYANVINLYIVKGSKLGRYELYVIKICCKTYFFTNFHNFLKTQSLYRLSYFYVEPVRGLYN